MTGLITEFDLAMMRLAIDQALNAATVGEVPVGAVVVRDGKVVATGFNHPIGSCDPTAHAEIRALRAAAEQAGNYRLPDCDLYVTLEPCAMCTGAILQARIRRLFFGALDPKTGACGSVVDLVTDHRLNHQTVVAGRLLEVECGRLLTAFFAGRRRIRRESSSAGAVSTGSRQASADGVAGASLGTEAITIDRVAPNENAVASDGIEIEFLDNPADS
jgi:tRNA(adenine34) deaminase